MSEPIISVSGLRGVVGESLTPDVAMRYAAAFAQAAPPGEIVIGRDSRPSGAMLAQAVETALQAAGRTTIDAGIAATPTTGVLVRHCRAAGGIEITASHNPAQYNGLKLFTAAGRVMPATEGRKVLELYRAASPAGVSRVQIGTSRRLDDPHRPHLDAVLAAVDVEAIRRRGFRVLLDSNGGAGGALGRRLLEALGCRVTILGEQPDGQFAHLPEPTAENLAGVLRAVVDNQAEIGFCQDPDADRLAVIDRAGKYLGEEYTLAICANHILQQRPGPLAANCATSRMTADIARKYGVPFVRAAVGEANVVDAMLAAGAVFGGEGNGGPIDPRVGLVRDSFVGMALLLEAMALRALPIARLAAELPRYEIVKTKYPLSADKLPAAIDALEKKFSDATVDRLDGMRLDWPDRWLLLRGSNTEPIVRAIAEAPTVAEAEALCSAAAEVLARV
jgi:phosphomannomutase